jgi:predicted Zn-dependent protease
MAPTDGKALAIFTMASQNTLQEAAQTTIEQLGLTLLENRNTTVNGMPAIVTLCKQVQQDQSTGTQQTNIVLSYFIDYSGKFFVFHGVSSEAEFGNYRDLLEGTMKTFNRLTDPAKLNVKPQKLLVKKTPKAGTLTSVLAGFGVKQDKMAELALLNNLELTSQIPSGKLIKIIGE